MRSGDVVGSAAEEVGADVADLLGGRVGIGRGEAEGNSPRVSATAW